MENKMINIDLILYILQENKEKGIRPQDIVKKLKDEKINVDKSIVNKYLYQLKSEGNAYREPEEGSKPVWFPSSITQVKKIDQLAIVDLNTCADVIKEVEQYKNKWDIWTYSEGNDKSELVTSILHLPSMTYLIWNCSRRTEKYREILFVTKDEEKFKDLFKLLNKEHKMHTVHDNHELTNILTK